MATNDGAQGSGEPGSVPAAMPSGRNETRKAVGLLAGSVFVCLLVVCGYVVGLPWYADRVLLPVQREAAAGPLTATAQLFAGPTQTAAAQVGATAAAQAQWPVTLADAFDSNDQNWTTADFTSHSLHIKQEIVNSKYRWELTLRDAGGSLWHGFPEAEAVSDFHLTVEVRQFGETANADAGVLFRRVDSDNYYYFGIDGAGSSIFALLYKGEWVDQRSWPAPADFYAGKPNQVVVSAHDDDFAFFVNGQLIGRLTDDRLTSGKVGLMGQVRYLGDPLILQFDDFTLRTPPVSQAHTAQATAASQLFATTSTWRLAFIDTFANAGNEWRVNELGDAYARVNLQIVSGQWIWTVTARQGVFWHESPHGASAEDFMLSVEARQLDGPQDAGYGLVFRLNRAGDLYSYDLNEAGESSFWRLAGGDWTFIDGWSRPASFQPGEMNRVTVIAQSTHFTFLINDQYVGEAEDSRLSSGFIGLGIDLAREGDQAQFAFDNLVLRVPPEAESAPTATRRPSRTPAP